MRTEEIPCCGNCPNKYIHHNSGMGTDRPRCKITKWFLDTLTFEDLENDYFKKSFCPLHPNAREYLMKEVLGELELWKRGSKSDDTDDIYRSVITLIKEGVKK